MPSPVYPYKNKPQPKSEHVTTGFSNGKKDRLGTKRLPAKLIVNSDERKQELAAIAADNNWVCDITVDAAAEENIADLTLLQQKPVATTVAPKINRNADCPCGSGKKYKRCCLS